MHDFRYHRQVFLFVLGLALFVLIGAQPQCARVEDNVASAAAGARSGGGDADSDCIDDCDSEAGDRRADEKRLHRDNQRACRDATDEVACLQEEAGRHLDALMAIAMDEFSCVAACGGFDSTDDCVDLCEDWVKRMTRGEERIHKKILKACGSDDDDGDTRNTGTLGGRPGGHGDDDGDTDTDSDTEGGGDPACVEQEMMRHADALDRIETFRADCEFACFHEQGGGVGGQ